jgi:hypothetical protein
MPARPDRAGRRPRGDRQRDDPRHWEGNTLVVDTTNFESNDAMIGILRGARATDRDQK